MPIIDYVYSAHSAFAYLGSRRLTGICEAHGVTLRHRPILLSPVIAPQGARSFAERTQAHVDYFFGREIERWAAFRNVPIIAHRPRFHDAEYSLASGMILALGPTGAATDAMAHALLEGHWRFDMDLSDRAALAGLATRLGHDADNLLSLAASPQVQVQLEANNAWAMAQPVFGSPTYILDGDPFYGQDRLELIEHALTHPFPPTRWSNPPGDAT